MKKTICKQLRALSRDLPKAHYFQTIGYTISGYELFKLSGDKSINKEKFYQKKKVQLSPINHYRKLKAYYKTYGSAAYLDHYLLWLEKHMLKMAAQLKSLDKKSKSAINETH